MSVAELKEKAIKSLESINDETVLEDIVLFLEGEVEYIRTGFVQLTEQQRAGLKEGLDDLSVGRVVTHNDILAETDRLLGNNG